MKNKFIPIAQPDLSGNELNYISDCILSGWISSKGEYIKKFENIFASFIGTKYAVSVANGTVALHLALSALSIGFGDEVIVPDLTFIASANSVSFTGAKSVFVDVERATWNIDPAKIEEKITNKTKAIIVVHLYGQPADLNRIIPIAKKYNLYLIEDAAEAHGAEIRINNQINTNNPITQSTNKKRLIHLEGGRMDSFQVEEFGGGIWRKVGSIGDAGVFSFYGNKIITTGEGGMVVTNDKKLADKMRILRDHGQKPERKYYHEVIGFNYRMTNMQAAIGCAQMERINQFLAYKKKIADFYDESLKGLGGIILPPNNSWSRNVYWMYSVLIKNPFHISRDEIMGKLSEADIETRPFFYPIHSLPPYKVKGNFPNTDYLSAHGLNLPSGTNLEDEDLERVVEVIKKYSS